MGGNVTVVGCGNIGSFLVDLLLRMPEVSGIALIDDDLYSEENVRSQSIARADVGMPKVAALARRAKRVRPEVRVTRHFVAVESLPQGCLNGDVICACLDSRISRMTVSEIAWRLGRPWIDAGVLGSELLARMDVYVPGDDACCMECGFGEQHYATLETRYPCQSDGAPRSPRTNAPAYLGALAASLQAAEVFKMLSEGANALTPGLQVLQGLRNRQHFVSVNRRNPRCRFDHRVFAPREISGAVSLGRVLFPVGSGRRSENPTLSAPGYRFLIRAGCPCRGTGHPILRCVRGAGETVGCPACGQVVEVHPFCLADRIRSEELPPTLAGRPLLAIGLRAGDLFTVTDSRGDRHYMITSRRTSGRGK